MIFFKKKPEAAGDSFHAAVNKAYKKSQARMEAKEARQRKIEDCSNVLHDCRFTFNKTIALENALAAEMQSKGFPVTNHHDRVRDCGIGILIVDQALFELKSIRSEDDMNSALNKMGMALRQLRRIDNSSAAVSNTSEKIIRQWYPDGLSSQALETALEDPAMPDVSEEVQAIVDEEFVQNLMAGNSIELCMLKRQQAPKADPTRADRARLMEEVRNATGIHEHKDVDIAAINEKYKNKF